MRYLGWFAGALAVAASMASPAAAAIYDFQLSGTRSADFQVDTSATPTFASSSGFGSQLQYSVTGLFGGVQEAGTVGFGTGLFATLNVGAAGLGFTQLVGPDLFNGDVANPVFNTGTFSLGGLVTGANMLTITEAVTAVPEPSTWAMMILGFCGVGFLTYRRNRTFLTTAA